MDTILYIEINIFSILILMTIAYKSSEFMTKGKLKNRLFALSVWSVAAVNAFDIIWKISVTSFWTLPVHVVWFTNFMYFLSFELSAYFWFLYTEATAKSKIFENRTGMIIAAIPLIILMILLIASLFDGCLFYFDENMNYHRGPLYCVQQILSYGYVVCASVRSLIKAAEKKNYVRRDELLILASFFILPMICGILQTAFQGAPIASMGVVVAFLLVYINSLRSVVAIDSVTGICNRMSLLRYLDDKCSSLKKDERLYFLFIDVDSFKSINDIYGHNEGDRALKMVARVLQDICSETNGFCARYGGDEFAIVEILKSDEDIALIRKRIYKSVESKSADEALAYSVSVSIGCAEYTEETDSLQDLISSADSNMYDKKNGKKETHIKN